MQVPPNMPWPIPAAEGAPAITIMRDRLWGRVAIALAGALRTGLLDGNLIEARHRMDHAMGALLATKTYEKEMLPLFRAAERFLPPVASAPDNYVPSDAEQESFFGVAYLALGLILARDGVGPAEIACMNLGISVPPWQQLGAVMPAGGHA